jgi:hypothetical protein
MNNPESSKKRFVTYLAGPIGDVPIGEARTWRNKAEQILGEMGIDVLNPLLKEEQTMIRRSVLNWCRTGNIDAIRPLVGRDLIEPDLKMVENSDFITLWLPKEGQELCGSYGEITYAFKLRIPVYIVTERRTKPLNIPYWAVGCSTMIFKEWDSYYKYIKENWTEEEPEQKTNLPTE